MNIITQKIQKNNYNSIRQSLQSKFFTELSKSTSKNPKQCPKRAIRAEDPPLVIPYIQIEKEVKCFNQKYTLGAAVGQGAHGLVRVATNNETLNQVAVKICRSGDPELVATFTDAFKNNRMLNHQFIIKVYECYIDQQSETLYLVMEYSPMPSLEEVLRIRKRLAEDQCRAIIRSVLVAIRHMHERGIAHRDLKPDNILLQQMKKSESKEQFYPIKIIDLGVSKKFKKYIFNEFKDTDMWTRTGTEFYTAPEIYQGGGYNEKVDIWSVGVTLYLMLSGDLPFYDETVYGTIDLILAGRLNLDSPYFSKVVRDLLRRLLNSNPQQRLNASMALLHPWFCVSTKFDPISPNNDFKAYRASDDIYEPEPNSYYNRHLHVRSNTITKSPHSNQDRSQPQCYLSSLEEQVDDIESPLIKLKKIQNQINREIHVTQKQQSSIQGLQRIKLKLSQKETKETEQYL